MLEKSIEYSHEFNIYFFNNIYTLARNELFDKNLTDENKDEIVEFELKTNHVGAGYFLLYFQGKDQFQICQILLYYTR